MKTHKGKITRVNNELQYGFIKTKGCGTNETFFSFQTKFKGKFSQFKVGDNVLVKITPSDRGPFAYELRRVKL